MIRGTLQTHGDGDTRGDMGKFGHRSRNNGRSGLLKYAQFTCLSVQGRNKILSSQNLATVEITSQHLPYRWICTPKFRLTLFKGRLYVTTKRAPDGYQKNGMSVWERCLSIIRAGLLNDPNNDKNCNVRNSRPCDAFANILRCNCVERRQNGRHTAQQV